ncbi:MAG: penicillin-binding protein [Acidobacteriota bacterium]
MIGQTAQTIQQLQLAKRRTLAVSLFFLIWAALISTRLVHYQVYKHDQMTALAERQQQRTIKTSPKRGSVLDRNGNELARSVEVESIYVAPSEITSPEMRTEMTKALAKILDLTEDVVSARLNSRRVMVSLKRKVTEQEAQQVKALNLRGIHFISETKRFYPKDELAANVLGFVGVDEEGFAGVERQYDRHIQGRSGYVFIETDAHGKPFGRYEKEAEVGQSLVLTIDEQIQFRTEKALRERITELNARGGCAVVIRPKTGEILAMATLPSFNPNEPVANTEELRERRRNRVVEDAYEPGSVFKIVTYSAALEAGLIKPDDKVDCQGGAITIAGHTVRDGGHYGLLTISEALEVSSNVAAIKTGRQLGKDLLLKAISRFGFGQSAGVGLPGESPGFVGGTSRWSEASFGSLPMGYQVSVTPLQLLAATAAIANGGEWVQPHILKHIVSTTGDVIYQPPVQTRRVISQANAEAMKNMLEGVILRGTAKHARLEGYTAAGKTGTARKYDTATGRYSETRYFASFCGFAPLSHPEVGIIVVIDEPRLGLHHGGQAAAPAFKQIAETALHALGIPPDDLNPDAPQIDKPWVVEGEIPEEYDIRQYTDTNRETDMPTVGLKEAGDANIKPAVTVVSFTAGNGGLVMPDLKGQGIRTALHRCKELGLRLTFQGVGEIVEQQPTAGTAVAVGSNCHVILKKLH